MTTQIPLDLAFNFEGSPIHAFFLSDKPAWLAAEIGGVLGLKDGAKGARESHVTEKGLDYDVVSSEILPSWRSDSDRKTPARPVTVLFESGLYALVLRSDKPAAIRFTRWVIRDVLPELRKTGAFSLLPEKLRPEALSQAQILNLVAQAGKGNTWAIGILQDLGLRPAASAEVPK